VTVGQGQTLSCMAVDALGNRSTVQTASRRVQITRTGHPEQNGVFPLDTPLTLTMSAVDTVTNQPVTGLEVWIAAGGSGPSQAAQFVHAGDTGTPFSWSFPSNVKYVSEHTGSPGPAGLKVVICTYYSATHYPSVTLPRAATANCRSPRARSTSRLRRRAALGGSSTISTSCRW
jgi:hypothetical protein